VVAIDEHLVGVEAGLVSGNTGKATPHLSRAECLKKRIPDLERDLNGGSIMGAAARSEAEIFSLRQHAE
jgi:hypothetical protein